jgi:hypothetical protein
MAGNFSSSFDALLADSKRQFDDLSRGTQAVPPPPARPPARAEAAAVATKAGVIEGRAGGIDFRLTTRSD